MESTLGQAIKRVPARPKMAASARLRRRHRLVHAGPGVCRPGQPDPGGQGLPRGAGQHRDDPRERAGAEAHQGHVRAAAARGPVLHLRREQPYGTTGNPKNLPKGATLDDDNVLVFKNQKDMQDFVDTFDRPSSVATRYFDTSGQRVTLASATPGQHVNKAWAVTFQNKLMEKGDNQDELRRRADELRTQGYDIADVRDYRGGHLQGRRGHEPGADQARSSTTCGRRRSARPPSPRRPPRRRCWTPTSARCRRPATCTAG